MICASCGRKATDDGRCVVCDPTPTPGGTPEPPEMAKLRAVIAAQHKALSDERKKVRVLKELVQTFKGKVALHDVQLANCEAQLGLLQSEGERLELNARRLMHRCDDLENTLGFFIGLLEKTQHNPEVLGLCEAAKAKLVRPGRCDA